MNNRVEIKIAVVGESSSGKEAFSNMLFLENPPKIRVDPLSKLGEIYIEIDEVNFENSSKKIMEQCRNHNDLILRQSEIKDVKYLVDQKIHPFFYRYVSRVKDIINYHENVQHINRNILLTFYFIGNNYKEFSKELNSSNIIIYITDVYQSLNHSLLRPYLVDLVRSANYPKHIITLVNKCDDLNPNGEYESGHKKTFINSLDKIIQDMAQKYNIQHLFSRPIPISCRFATIFRKIIFSISQEISVDDKSYISNIFGIKKDLLKDICRDNNKYLRRCGFIAFREYFLDILSKNYKTMIDQVFDTDVNHLEQMFNTDKNGFIEELKMIKNRTNRLEKIFKKNYNDKLIAIIKKILTTENNIEELDIDIIEKIKEVYDNHHTFTLLENFLASFSKNYGNKIEQIILSNLKKLEPLFRSNKDNFFNELKIIKTKIIKLEKLFKKNYNDMLVLEIEKILTNAENFAVLDLDIIEKIKEIYDDNPSFIKYILSIGEKFYDTIKKNVNNKLYSNKITEDNFLPSRVHNIFDQICNLSPCKDDIYKLAVHICELYSSKIIEMLEFPETMPMLYNIYFNENESMKMMSMLTEIKSMMKFDEYKMYLIKILLAKIMMADYCINTNYLHGKDSIIMYFKSLRYYLATCTNKKYEYLFGNILDICQRNILKIEKTNNIRFMIENIDLFMNFKSENIDLDKFIISLTKKNTYHDTIAKDQDDSNEDSDIEIYDTSQKEEENEEHNNDYNEV